MDGHTARHSPAKPSAAKCAWERGEPWSPLVMRYTLPSVAARSCAWSEIGPDGGSGNSGSADGGAGARWAAGGSGARAGRRHVTWEEWAARCAYDLVIPRSRCGAGGRRVCFEAASRTRPRYFAVFGVMGSGPVMFVP